MAFLAASGANVEHEDVSYERTNQSFRIRIGLRYIVKSAEVVESEAVLYVRLVIPQYYGRPSKATGCSYTRSYSS